MSLDSIHFTEEAVIIYDMSPSPLHFSTKNRANADVFLGEDPMERRQRIEASSPDETTRHFIWLLSLDDDAMMKMYTHTHTLPSKECLLIPRKLVFRAGRLKPNGAVWLKWSASAVFQDCVSEDLTQTLPTSDVDWERGSGPSWSWAAVFYQCVNVPEEIFIS